MKSDLSCDTDPKGIQLYFLTALGVWLCGRGTTMNETVHGSCLDTGKLLHGSNNSPAAVHNRVTIKLDRHNPNRQDKLAGRPQRYLYSRTIMGELNAKAAACGQPHPQPEVPSSEDRIPDSEKGSFGMNWKPTLGIEVAPSCTQQQLCEVDTIMEAIQFQEDSFCCNAPQGNDPHFPQCLKGFILWEASAA